MAERHADLQTIVPEGSGGKQMDLSSELMEQIATGAAGNPLSYSSQICGGVGVNALVA